MTLPTDFDEEWLATDPKVTCRRKFLYKYVTSEACHRILESGTLQWSAPDQFNDPGEIDVLPNLELPSNFEEVVSGEVYDYLRQIRVYRNPDIFGQFIKSLQPHVNEITISTIHASLKDIIQWRALQIPEFVKRMTWHMKQVALLSRYLCLSETPKDGRMWSHYADSHRGCVLQFSSASEVDSFFSSARPILYSSSLIDIFDVSLASEWAAGDHWGFDFSAAFMDYMYTKDDVFSYEREWRLRCPITPDPWLKRNLISFPPADLTAIICGRSMSATSIDQIKETLPSEYPHCKLYSTRFGKPPSFELTFTDV